MNVAAKTALIAILPALLAGCGNGDNVVLLGTLERDRVEIAAEAHEPIVAIAVHEGDKVPAGATLVTLDPAAIDLQLAAAGARVSETRRRLAELVQGPRRDEILAARAAVEAATARHAAESREFDRVQALADARLLAPNTLDRQRAQRDSADAERRRAEAEWQLLVKGTRIEQLDQARAALDGALAGQAILQLQHDRLVSKAPVAGTIDALPYELGERPPAGAPLAVLLADGQPYARVYLPEPLRASVRPGRRAQVRVDGTERDWRGTVRYVSSEAAFTPYYALTQKDRRRLGFLAEVVLDEPEAAQLPAGVPVEVRLEAGASGP